jgi:hypothetical protein
MVWTKRWIGFERKAVEFYPDSDFARDYARGPEWGDFNL